MRDLQQNGPLPGVTTKTELRKSNKGNIEGFSEKTGLLVRPTGQRILSLSKQTPTPLHVHAPLRVNVIIKSNTPPSKTQQTIPISTTIPGRPAFQPQVVSPNTTYIPPIIIPQQENIRISLTKHHRRTPPPNFNDVNEFIW